MASEEASGTQLAVISTEPTLATITDAGVYQLFLDAKNMVNGDVLELRAKMKVLTGSTAGQASIGQFSNIQSDPVVFSIPFGIVWSIAFTLKQTAGTGRNFDWSVVQLDA